MIKCIMVLISILLYTTGLYSTVVFAQDEPEEVVPINPIKLNRIALEKERVYLSDMTELRWGNLYKHLFKNSFTIGGKKYKKSLGTHPKNGGVIGFVEYKLDKKFSSFHAIVGMWEPYPVNSRCDSSKRIGYKVFVDGVTRASGISLYNHRIVDVKVTGAELLRLQVDDGGDEYWCDWFAWADAYVVCNGTCDKNMVASASSTDPKNGITTTSVRNPDGSRTVTKIDKSGKIIAKAEFPPKGKEPAKGVLFDPKTGKVTTVLTNPDGSRNIAKGKVKVDKDGTEHSTVIDDNGNSIDSTIAPDGVVTIKKTDKYGNAIETILNTDGTLTSVEKTVTGYTTETSRDAKGVIKDIRKDLDGSVIETVEKYPDGLTVRTDKHGNVTQTYPVDENGDTVVVRVDKKGNEKLIVMDDNSQIIFKDEERVTPKEHGREYYETVLGGEDWEDLPKSTRMRYAGAERRIRENAAIEQQRKVWKQEEVVRQQQEQNKQAESGKEMDKSLAAIRAEQDTAHKQADERKSKQDRARAIQESYDKADKLQNQYDEAVKRGDRKEARHIERLQDEHELASDKVLAFTDEEKKAMESKTALRQKLMDKINREAAFEADKEDQERTKNDSYKDVALEGASFVLIGAEQQRDLAKSNRQEDRMLSKTKYKDQIIDRMLNSKNLTAEESDILLDSAKLTSTQRSGALEKKAANNRIIAAGYAIDAAMLIGTAGAENILAGAGSKIVGKIAAKQAVARFVEESVARGVARQAAEKAAIKVSSKAGQAAAERALTILTKADLTRMMGSKVASKVMERVVAKQTAKKVLGEQLAKGVGREAAERAARTAAERIAGRAGKKVGKEVTEHGLINVAGSKVGGKIADKFGSKELGKAVEASLLKKRNLFPKANKSPFGVAKEAGVTGTEVMTAGTRGAKARGGKLKPSSQIEPVKYPKGKKPSAISQEKRQAYNDAVLRKKYRAAVERAKRDPDFSKRFYGEDLDPVLPSPTGKLTEPAVGELSKDLTPKQTEELFKPGANLSPKQIQEKADLFRKQLKNGKKGAGSKETVRPPGFDSNKTLAPQNRVFDENITGATTILDDPLKGAAGRGGKGETQVLKPAETVIDKTERVSTQLADTVVDRVGKKSSMPRGKIGGMPEGRVGTMPRENMGGVAALKKGYPRGMPDSKGGGIIDKSILKSRAGKKVTDPRIFGMEPRVMRSIQKEVDQAGLRVRVREANDASLAQMRAGHPPKHVKLKSKTINDLDVLLGAKPGSQGQVGYFKPTKPKELKLPEKPNNPKHLEKYHERVKKITDAHEKLHRRYKQRLKEYSDNYKGIKKLKDKGLITVEDGVVVDRGLSNTRLGKNGKLIIDSKGPVGGTGKGFTGDHDMWDITHPDGRPIIMDPGTPGFNADAALRKMKLQKALDKGLAQTQHGPHKDWKPVTKRDIAIDKKIRGSHKPGGEALLEFNPNQPPRTSYEIE